MSLFHQLLIICPLVFFAGVVDSIAGGGGIISLPAYLAAGLPAHAALATNKFAATFGTATATARFIKNKKIHYPAAAAAVVAALIGSPIGVSAALITDDRILRYILLAALPLLAVFILKNKNFNNDGSEKNYSLHKILALSFVSGFVIGLYDGFFGPGTGTFLILIFNLLLGFDLLTAAGTAKAVNLASNVAALVTFLISGNIIIVIGATAILFSVAGNYVGSGLALRNGVKAIRPMFVVVLLMLIIKIGYDLIKAAI